MRHEKLRVRFLKRVGHFFDVVGWRGARDLTTDAKGGVHGDGVPNGVLAEQGDGVAFFEAIFLDEGGGEVRGCFFDFAPVQCLLRYSIMVAAEFFLGEPMEGRVGWVFEEPLPGCDVAWDCYDRSFVSMTLELLGKAL